MGKREDWKIGTLFCAKESIELPSAEDGKS